MERNPPVELQEFFERRRREPSDINEHLMLLRDLANRCEHVTEIGLRWGNGSTVAFLAAQPASLISWDIQPGYVVHQNTLNLIQMSGRTRFQPRVGDSLEIEIEETDFLFFDGYHTARQLRDELRRHCSRARKYIGFHDTASFAMQGEDGSTPGLRAAIHWFQRNTFPLWKVIEDRENNNGLVVLERAGWGALEKRRGPSDSMLTDTNIGGQGWV